MKVATPIGSRLYALKTQKAKAAARRPLVRSSGAWPLGLNSIRRRVASMTIE